MYLWAKLPPGFTDDTAFCLALLAATGVALSPGSGFGPGGAGHVRFALVRDESVLLEAAKSIRGWLLSPAAARLRVAAVGVEGAQKALSGAAGAAAVVASSASASH